MSEFKKLEDRFQRWIRQAAGLYETEIRPGQNDSVWGDLGAKHELPEELQRLLADRDPHSEESPPPQEPMPLESGWLQDLFRPVLDRMDKLELEIQELRKEVNKSRSTSNSKSKSKTRSTGQSRKTANSSAKSPTKRKTFSTSKSASASRKSSNSKSKSKSTRSGSTKSS